MRAAEKAPQIPVPTDLDSLQSVLLSDVMWALDRENVDGSSRRAAVRAVFAAVEGMLWALQCELLNAVGRELTAPEKELLRKRPHVLKQNGAVARVPARLALKQRLEFTATLVARLRPEFGINFHEEGWKSLLSTLEVSDRLKHPENAADLDVTAAEVSAAVCGQAWFLDNLVAAAQSGLRDYQSHHEKRSTASIVSKY